MLARQLIHYVSVAPFVAPTVMLVGLFAGIDWLLFIGIAAWFSVTPALLWLWFFAGDGDGGWPFGHGGGDEPRFYGPEVRHLMTFHLRLFAVLFSVALLSSLVLALFDPPRIADLPEGLFRFGILVLIAFPVLFGYSWLNSLFMIAISSETRRHSLIPQHIVERRARFYEKWPDVEGWG